MATQLQAFILKKPAFSFIEALRFARRHGARKLEETAGSYRVRMRDPGRLRARGFRRFRTLPISDGITAVIAARGPMPNLPRGSTGMIPGEVERIFYRRSGSKFPGPYQHRFTPGAIMYAMPNGDVVIRSLRGKRLWGRY